MTEGRLTLFTSVAPAHLGKVFKKAQDGTITKEVAGNMYQGRYETLTFNSAQAFATLLQNVGTNQAISASLCTRDPAGEVVTDKALPNTPGAVSRSKRFFALKPGPGFVCLDADAPKTGKPLSTPELFALLCKVVPEAAQAPVIAYQSGSSLIFEGETQHRGVNGTHLYLLVKDTSDTERFGKVLTKRLALVGHLRIEISKSGSLLPRTVFDGAVHEPARLIFSGGAVCHPPLEQRRGTPVILGGGAWLDTLSACPDLTPDEEAKYEALLASEKAKAQPLCHRPAYWSQSVIGI